jgi:hypothetical protein
MGLIRAQANQRLCFQTQVRMGESFRSFAYWKSESPLVRFARLSIVCLIGLYYQMIGVLRREWNSRKGE